MQFTSSFPCLDSAVKILVLSRSNSEDTKAVPVKSLLCFFGQSYKLNHCFNLMDDVILNLLKVKNSSKYKKSLK